MSIYKKIANAAGEKTNDMICTRCHTFIESGDYLVIEHAISKRGNENDYYEPVCFECSRDDKTWFEYFESITKDELRQLKNLQENKNKAIELIRKADDIDIEEDSYGSYIITLGGNFSNG
jgi:hypothetical protein